MARTGRRAINGPLGGHGHPRRRGKRKALVATARAILVIIFHLVSDPAARFNDLGPGYHDDKISAERKIRNHVRQREALGLTVTIAPPRTPPPASGMQPGGRSSRHDSLMSRSLPSFRPACFLRGRA